MAGQPSLASLREILPGLPSRSSRSERRIQAFDNIDVFLVLGLAEARLRSSSYGGQPSLTSLREILPGLPSRSSRSERRIQAFDNIDVFLVLGLAEARLRSSSYGGAAF